MRLRVGFPSDCVAGDLAASDLDCVFVRVCVVLQLPSDRPVVGHPPCAPLTVWIPHRPVSRQIPQTVLSVASRLDPVQ